MNPYDCSAPPIAAPPVQVVPPPLRSTASGNETPPIRPSSRRLGRWATALAAVLLVSAGAGLKTLSDRSGLSWDRLPVRIVWAADDDARSGASVFPTELPAEEPSPRIDDQAQVTFAAFDQSSPPTAGIATDSVRTEPKIVEAVWHTPRATNPVTENLTPSEAEFPTETVADSDFLEQAEASRPLRAEDVESPALVDANEVPLCHAADTCAAPDNKLGTSIEWIANVEDAARLANEQGKLVYLIQVSGNFAREEFT